jgi:hypothetical protein
MKLMRTDVTSWTIPGTLIDIRVLIVRKEKSSNIFQIYCTNKQLKKSGSKIKAYKIKLTTRDSEI